MIARLPQNGGLSFPSVDQLEDNVRYPRAPDQDIALFSFEGTNLERVRIFGYRLALECSTQKSVRREAIGDFGCDAPKDL